jgi:hypothetical protein
MIRRWRLVLAAVAFIGWLSYLGYAALTKNRGPVVSHIQVAAAKHAIVAEVNAGPDGKPDQHVTVVEALSKGGPAKGSKIELDNLPRASGFIGPGQYLLLLTDHPPFLVVGQQRSPGNDLSGLGSPLIYPWSDEVKREYEKLAK